MKKQIPSMAALCVLWPWQAQASFFDYVELQPLSPPMIQVSGDAQGWQEASDSRLTFPAQARGKCSWGHRVTFVSTTLRRHAHGGGALLDSERLLDDPKNKAMTWSSSWKPVSLQWNPDKAMLSEAVQACRAALDEQVQQGQDRRSVLNQGITTQLSGPSFGLHFSCDDHGIVGDKRDIFRNTTVAVRCEPLNLPAPTPAMPAPTQVQAPQEIKHVSLAVTPAQHQGPCPVTLSLRGVVHHLPTGGQVQYRFSYDGKPLSDFVALQLAPEQANTVVERAHVVTPVVPPALPGNVKALQAAQPPMAEPPLQLAPLVPIELEVRHGQRSLKAQAGVSIQCKAPPPRQPAPTAKPDLTSVNGMQIGQQHSPWGGQLNLNLQDATQVGPRGCTWRFAYDVLNASQAPASMSLARLSAASVGPLHQSNVVRAPSAHAPVSGSLTLPAGQHLVELHLDDTDTLSETSEANNVFRMMVTAPAACSAAEPPAPARRDRPRL